MKTLLILIVGLSLSSCLSNPVKKYVNDKYLDQVVFNGKKFIRADLKTQGDDFLYAAYLPEGENLKTFNEMLEVIYYKGSRGLTMKQEAEAKLAELKRQFGKSVVGTTLFNEKEGSAVADFMINDSDGTEHNVMKFSKSPKGRVIRKLVRRAYLKNYKDKNDPKFIDFFMTAKNKRLNFISNLNSKTLPNPNP